MEPGLYSVPMECISYFTKDDQEEFKGFGKREDEDGMYVRVIRAGDTDDGEASYIRMIRAGDTDDGEASYIRMIRSRKRDTADEGPYERVLKKRNSIEKIAIKIEAGLYKLPLDCFDSLKTGAGRVEKRDGILPWIRLHIRGSEKGVDPYARMTH